MYAVIVSRGFEYDRYMNREDAEIMVAQLRAAGRTSARVERVTL
jgi:hypothetical protein